MIEISSSLVRKKIADRIYAFFMNVAGYLNFKLHYKVIKITFFYTNFLVTLLHANNKKKVKKLFAICLLILQNRGISDMILLWIAHISSKSITERGTKMALMLFNMWLVSLYVLWTYKVLQQDRFFQPIPPCHNEPNPVHPPVTFSIIPDVDTFISTWFKFGIFVSLL